MRRQYQIWSAVCCTALLIGLLYAATATAEDFTTARQSMLEDIRLTTEYARDQTGIEAMNPRVLAAMGRVPRHRFVPDGFQKYAYLNRPLPIGHEQTISQPYIVALMTHLAEPEAGNKVLEIGTGSGYQAAVLAELVDEVYTIEIVAALGRQAQTVLRDLQYRNVHVRIGDGYAGWEEHAPYDAVLVTAAPEDVPQPLLEQLKPGGRLVIPLGSQSGAQALTVFTKQPDGSFTRKEILSVAFVPLTGNKN